MSATHSRASRREIVAACLRSGLSVKAFAHQIGVKPSQLSWWKRQLAEEPHRSDLVRVEVVDASPVPSRQPSMVHATVGPAELRFSTDIAPAYLGELVAAIARASRC